MDYVIWVTDNWELSHIFEWLSIVQTKTLENYQQPALCKLGWSLIVYSYDSEKV